MKSRITQEMWASVPDLLAEGLDRKQIAERFGTTMMSLQVMACRRKIPLWRHDRPRMPKLALPDTPPTPINLRAEYRHTLRERAQALGLDEAKLAAKLLHYIIKDDLICAVLDTKEAVQ